MKRLSNYFFIILSLLTVSHQSPATDDLSDAGTGTFSTNQTKKTIPTSQSQEEKPEEQNDEYNSFGENLYNQNVDTSPYELEKKKKMKNQKNDSKY
jgi:hypothetical protein